MKRRIGVVFDGCCGEHGEESAEKIAVLVPEEVTTVKELKRFVVPKTSERDGSWSIYQKRFAKEFLKAKRKEGSPEGAVYKFKAALYFYENGLRILDEDTLDIIKDNDIIRCRVTSKPKQAFELPKKAAEKTTAKSVETPSSKSAKPKKVATILPKEKREEEPPKKKQKAQASKHLFFDSDGEIVPDENEPNEEEKVEEVTKEGEEIKEDADKAGEAQGKKKRKRRRKNKKKEDTLVNVSVVLDSANPPPPNTPAHKIDTPVEPVQQASCQSPKYTPDFDISPKHIAEPSHHDIESSESLKRTPEKGDVVGWKEVYLSENFVPEYTDWKVGTVSSVDSETGMVTFEDPAQEQVVFTHMLMPKLIKSGSSQPHQPAPSPKKPQESCPIASPQKVEVNEKPKKIPSCKGLAATLAQLRKNSNN